VRILPDKRAQRVHGPADVAVLIQADTSDSGSSGVETRGRVDEIHAAQSEYRNLRLGAGLAQYLQSDSFCTGINLFEYWSEYGEIRPVALRLLDAGDAVGREADQRCAIRVTQPKGTDFCNR